MDNYSQTQPTYSKQKAPFPRKLVFLMLMLILLCAGGFAGVKYLQEGNTSQALVSPESNQVEELPTATPTQITPTPDASPSPSTSVTPSPSAKLTPTKAAGTTAKSSVTVSILNGSGVSGAASKISTTLKDAGYQIGTVGNAPTFDYTDISIQVKKSKSSLLTQLKGDLTGYTIGSSSATLAESNAADAVVIVGK